MQYTHKCLDSLKINVQYTHKGLDCLLSHWCQVDSVSVTDGRRHRLCLVSFPSSLSHVLHKPHSPVLLAGEMLDPFSELERRYVFLNTMATMICSYFANRRTSELK